MPPRRAPYLCNQQLRGFRGPWLEGEIDKPAVSGCSMTAVSSFIVLALAASLATRSTTVR